MESIDFTGLAARAVAGLHEVRACLLASRDGLTLAALPEGGETLARRALDRLETVGQPERGFLVIGDEVWVVSRRGPYLGIIVAAASARAGLLLDRLESTLRAAEEARLLAGSAGPGRPEIPRRPRTTLHRETRSERSEQRPAKPLFDEVRVVSVPEKEREATVGEAAATTAWPHVIRKPEAPTVGGPGSGSEPPTIFRPGIQREEPKIVAPEPEAEEPKVVAPEAEPEEPKGVTPEPEPEPEEPKGVTPEREDEDSIMEASDPVAEMLEIAALEPDLTSPEPEEPEVSALVPEQEPEEEKAPVAEEPKAAVEEESESADLEMSTPEPEVEEPKILASEPEAAMPRVDVDQELPHTVAPEPQPAAFDVDSPNLEPGAPSVEPDLDAMKLAAPEPPQEQTNVEPVRAEDTPSAQAPEVHPMPPQRLAHPEIEPPKATPHYSPPDALLGEMGRVVAGETPPADILPPGVFPVEAPGAPTDATKEEAADAVKAKESEASKERGEDTEVDPVALAREFSQLFDEPERNS